MSSSHHLAQSKKTTIHIYIYIYRPAVIAASHSCIAIAISFCNSNDEYSLYIWQSHLKSVVNFFRAIQEGGAEKEREGEGKKEWKVGGTADFFYLFTIHFFLGLVGFQVFFSLPILQLILPSYLSLLLSFSLSLDMAMGQPTAAELLQQRTHDILYLASWLICLLNRT